MTTLVEVVRGGVVESRHRGSVVLLDPDGRVAAQLGDPTTPGWPRSAAKVAQAAAMVRAGLDLPPDLLALAAASHSGGSEHLDNVRRILSVAAADEDALGCPADLPLGLPERIAWYRAGLPPRRLAHNCSGKHAAMLATCRVRGWDPAGYLAADHPLQRGIRDEIHDRAEEEPTAVSVDGCGAPLFGLSLAGLARMFRSAVTSAAGTPQRRVADAMRSYPQLVAGAGRDVTAFMAAVPGLLAKDGAEGGFAVALPDGRAMALKIDDGSERARPVVVAAVLAAWGVDVDALGSWAAPPVLGGDRPVGELRPSPHLRHLLA